MASRKHKRGKEENAGPKLGVQQQQELEMLLDRLKVQDPQGLSLESHLQSLHGTLSGKEAIAVTLLEKLSKPPTEVGYRFYQMVKGLFTSKEYRRTAKQVGYRFQQAGFGVAATPEETREVALVTSEVKQPIAHMSSLDDEGVWMICALVPDAQLGRVVVTMMMRGALRFLDLKHGECTQRAYRQLLQETAHGVGSEFQEIPMWHAARTAFDCLENSSETLSPDHAKVIRKLFKPYFDPDRPPYAYELLPQLDEPRERLRQLDPATLLRSLPANALLFAKTDLQPTWERIQATDHSVLVVSPAVKEQRTQAIIEEAADRLCAGKMRYALQRFFEEQALYFKLSGNADAVVVAWITAQQLRTAQAASQNPVIVALINLSLYRHWRGEFPPEQESGKPEPFYQSESGLVIRR
jgi:hypothetical protein